MTVLAVFVLGGQSRSEAQEPSKFYLPNNPVAAAYILNRLSNAELIGAPRSEFVYVALLQRRGLDPKYRQEALNGLAEARKTDALTQLIAGLSELDRKGEEAEPVLRELAPLLLETNGPSLTGKKEALEKLVEDAQLHGTRQLGYAALVTALGNLDAVWAQAETNPEHLSDLIRSAPLLRDPKLRQQFFARLESLATAGDSPEVRPAAIAALGALPGHERAAFKLLAGLVRAGTARTDALASLQQISKKSWPKEEAARLVESLMAYFEGIPAAQRTEEGYVSAVQFATELASLLPAEESRWVSKILRGLGVRVIVLRTLPEQMLYDTQLLVVEAGKPVEIVLINDDVMQHNLVVVAPGALEEIGTASEKMPPNPDSQGRHYVPDSPKVLHATKMLNPGERAKLSFTAPTMVGDYDYVCTFPGHWRRMTGKLAVVKDVDDYLATHAQPAALEMTEWKVSDLAPDLGRVSSGRNLDEGRKMFSTLACAQCHKIGGPGYAYGPDLTDVFKRWEGDRAAVLGEIVEPSRQVAERYRNYQFELQDGETALGMIVSETPEAITIHSGPADALIQTIPKSRIKGRQLQALSVMPAGLLNTMSKEQILNLLAFLEAGGATQPHAGHQH